MRFRKPWESATRGETWKPRTNLERGTGTGVTKKTYTPDTE